MASPLPTRERALELVMRQDAESPWAWDCRCGASVSGWVGEDDPKPSELLCEECLSDLAEELGVVHEDEYVEWCKRVEELVDGARG